MTTSDTDKIKEYAAEAVAKLPKFDKDFEKVASYFGYQFTSGQKTKKEVEDFLFHRISTLLKTNSEEFPHKNFKKIHSQLVVDEYVFGMDIHNVYTASSIIWDASRQINIKDIDDKTTWVQCCQLALAKRELGYDPYMSKNDTEELNYSKAIKYFRDMKINLKVIDGDIPPDEKEMSKILAAIEYRAQLLGNKGIDYLNTELCALYSTKLEWFLIQRKVHTYLTTREPSSPYGFLLNIVSKYISKEPRKKKNYDHLWEELLELATNYIALYELEPYTPYKHMYGMGDNFVTTIQHSVLYDNIFLFKQLPLGLSKFLFDKLFQMDSTIADKVENQVGFNQNDVISLLEHIEYSVKKHRTISLSFSQSWLETSQRKINRERVNKIISLFVRSSGGLNKRYKTPFDYVHSEIDDYPINKVDDSTFKLTNIGIFPVQLFERYLSILRDYDKGFAKADRINIDQLIGDNMELLLSNAFGDNGINFLHSEEYKIDSATRSYLSTDREDGECDFIIETDNAIIFLRIKKESFYKKIFFGVCRRHIKRYGFIIFIRTGSNWLS